ncbi:MAG: Gfo/Idh/MocA family oxidoreductase [Pedosphaera sp.]|nr:Gfo/Idh/MocA family oxidoreductase [Pedosphaera sp.]
MNNFSRREFLRRSSLAVAGAAFAAPFINGCATTRTPSDVVLHASIGAGGQARSDLMQLVGHKKLKLVAVADVDLTKAGKLKEKFPDLRIYQDWRELLKKEKDLTSVNVSTPDHLHAPIGMTAMQLGKHVYIQKPLAHDIYEVRRLTEFAEKKKLVTQMGIQVHSASDYRRAVRIIQDGAIGKVKEVHSWCGKGWGDLTALPDRRDTPPAGFDWNLWLGVMSDRPFIGDGYYHPGNWRKRLDFGTGTFGDMGCHIFDPVFSALELTAPLTVRSEGKTPNQWNWATDGIVHYVFPGTSRTQGKTIKVSWYDGESSPPAEVLALIGNEPKPGCGSIFIGTKGVMLLPHINRPKLFPGAQFEEYPMPKVEDGNHYHLFVDAILGGTKPGANFNYAGPLTESVLLGSVACRFPKTTLEWDAKSLRFTNLSEANIFLRRKYRHGWEVKGLS